MLLMGITHLFLWLVNNTYILVYDIPNFRRGRLIPHLILHLTLTPHQGNCVYNPSSNR